MRQVLDIVALRSLIAVADCGGFHRAAETLALSQSAVSQHVRRLEKTLGRPVVERDGRKTRFTVDGRLLLEEARRLVDTHDEALRRLLGEDALDADTIVIGCTEHGAEQILPALTEAVREVRPHCTVRFRIDRSARLVEAVDRGVIDLAVYVAEATATPGTAVGGLPLRWYAAPEWVRPAEPAPLPLVAIEEPCAIRRRALSALSAHHTPATVVADAGYLAGVLDAARAGIGVALVATVGRQRPDGLTACDDLPPVPAIPLNARTRRGADPSLAAAAVTAIRTLLQGPTEPVHAA
jgi:DNA-binding transcriptional LysR family regulator